MFRSNHVSVLLAVLAFLAVASARVGRLTRLSSTELNRENPAKNRFLLQESYLRSSSNPQRHLKGSKSSKSSKSSQTPPPTVTPVTPAPTTLAPTEPGATPAPTPTPAPTKSSSSSKSSKSKSSKSSKSSKGTPSPTVAPVTLAPTTPAPTTLAPTEPGATPAPTTLAPTEPGATPAPTEPGATPAPTEPVATPAPTEPGATPAPTTAAPTTAGVTPAPTECTSNPEDYNVNVDVQIQFLDDEFAACDDEAQDSAINTNIQAALNENFATTVTDWQGTATFGTFVFDPDQEVNNVDPFARRGIRHLGEQLAGFELPVQRNLQSGTCPSRAAVDCTADYCRWGCVTAATTDCGDPASTTDSWTNLAEDIRARLATLGFDCLGIADQLAVVLVVDDPAAARTANTGSVTRSGPFETVKLSDFDESTTDEDIEALPVASKLVFNFFEGKGEEPTQKEVNLLVKETEAFFRKEFKKDAGFSTAFKDFQMSDIASIYDGETTPDQFTLEFLALVLLDKEAAAANTIDDLSDQKARNIMSTSSFREYIGKYVRGNGPLKWDSEFLQTHSVHFTGASHGG